MNNQQYFDSLDHGYLIVDDKLIVSVWNKWLSVNTQIPTDEILGKSLEEIYPKINYTTLLRKVKTTLTLNSPTFYDSNSNSIFFPIKRYKVTKTSIDYMKLQITISPYQLDESKVMISLYDISELFDAKISLQNEMKKVNELNSTLAYDQDIIDKNIMMVSTDLEGKVLEASSLFCNFFEYTKDQIIGKNISMFKSSNMSELTFKELWESISNKKPWTGDLQNTSSSGKNIWVNTRITPIIGPDNLVTGFTAVYQDIIDRKILEKLYVTDTLTQIYNRAYFDELMAKVAKYQRKRDIDFVILMLDIDFFKKVNDTYGHQIGDEALKIVAQTVKATLRENDIVARWGGEEFIIMLKHVNIEEAQKISEHIRLKIEQTPIHTDLYITASFGLTQYYKNEDTNKTFKRADDALYEAKDTGRNKVVTKL